MSYILDALNKAHQREQQRKAPKSGTAELAFESSAWQVKMVSPVRNTRFRLEVEVVNADVTRVLKALQTLTVPQQRVTARNRQPAVTEQKRPTPLPPAAGPPPLASGFPLGAQNPSQLDTAEAASAKVYSIR